MGTYVVRLVLIMPICLSSQITWMILVNEKLPRRI